MRSSRAGRRLLSGFEGLLLLVAAIFLGYYGWRSYDIWREQAKAVVEVEQALGTTTTGRHLSREEFAAPPPLGGVIGRLTIPRLGLSAPVKAGEDNSVLDFSVGYLRDTPPPWMPGNSAFAAHRDRLFRPLENIVAGDEIDLSTTHGNIRYRVLKTFIVEPDDVWVLDQIPNVNLTLITCYPFYYVGRAPHRFVVQAGKL
jgi:LPXTG-site transpeptidase (sortase) family protein